MVWQHPSPPIVVLAVCNESTHQLLKGRHRDLWAVSELRHFVSVHLSDETIILTCEVEDDYYVCVHIIGQYYCCNNCVH